MREPQAVPLGLFAMVVLQLAALPVQNVVVRHIEAAADWTSLQATRDPRAETSLFRRLAITARADPDPPTWSYLLLENHPTIMQRIAMVEAWRKRNGR
jgi:STE24 endopeptidase